MRITPQKDGTDGFFAVVLKRKWFILLYISKYYFIDDNYKKYLIYSFSFKAIIIYYSNYYNIQ